MQTSSHMHRQAQHKSPNLSRSETPSPTVHRHADLILQLQRTVGNQAVQRLLEQGEFDDPGAISKTKSAVSSGGVELEPAIRQEMEQRFNHDFSPVRVHSDAAAQRSAHDLSANAYTVGNDIVFGSGAFTPGTVEGRGLIAHELAHVVQQSRGGPAPTVDRFAPHEQDAQAAATAVTEGLPSVNVAASTAVGLARDTKTGTSEPAHRKRKIRPYVDPVPMQPQWVLKFENLVFRHEVIDYLFKSGALPAGFSVEPTGRFDGDPSLHWTVSWTGHLSDYEKELTEDAQALRSKAIQGGEMTPSEAAIEKFHQEEERDAIMARRHEQNKVFLPWLGMTATEALQRLKPGAYLASASKGMVCLTHVAPGETFQAHSEGLEDYGDDGYFVWVGSQDGETTLDMCPVSSNTNFQRDMLWYLRSGLSLKQALAKFDKDTTDTYIAFVKSFALALTVAPGTGPRGDIEEQALSVMARDVERATESESRPVTSAIEGDAGHTAAGAAARDVENAAGATARPGKDFTPLLSHIDPLEAANTAVATAAWVQDHILNKSDDPEIQGVSDAVADALQAKFQAVPEDTFNKDLRTGQLGEAIIKKTLELRGYSVVALQNASGHGVDLVGIKVSEGGPSLIVYLEVKSSSKDYRGRLSVAQKDSPEFVRSRLKQLADHQGFYKNVDPRAVDVAKLLISEIDAGRPIGGIRADVHWLSRGLSFEVEFAHWKPPTARVRP